MMMPGRKYSAESDYRYGFNGKEQDNEISSTSTYDYGFRIYNPAIGKFLSVDPLTKSYPMLTPYQYASNTPIAAIDLDGLESKITINAKRETVNPAINTTGATELLRKSDLQMQIMNWLIPRLNISGATADKYSQLSTGERTSLIQETVSNYLTFNMTESMASGFSGDITRTEMMSADLNYELVFGSKTSPKIEEFRNAMNDIYDEYYTKYAIGIVDDSKYGKVANGILKKLDFADNAVNGDYISLTGTVLEHFASKYIDKTIELNIARGLIPLAAKGIASRALGVFTNILSSLDAGAGSSTKESVAARKKTEGDLLHRNVVAGLIFYFTNGNQFEKAQKSKLMEDLQKPKQDNLTQSSNGNAGGF